ncbi:rRNA biogenesis protein RRP5 [Entamoeba marina]
MKPADIGDVDVGDEDEHGIIDVWKLAIKKKIAKKKENLGIDTVVKENNNAEEEEEKVEEEFVMDVDKKPEVVWEDENFEDIKENEMEEEEEEEEDEGEEEEDVDNQSSASEQPMEEEEEENEGVETYDLDECQRSVVAYPDNSLEWIKLMHCYIQAKNVTEARNTAHEALEKINFRKLDEKLNIWKALLQIESKHGDVKSLTKTYNEALEVCDRKKLCYIWQEFINTQEMLQMKKRYLEHYLKRLREVVRFTRNIVTSL